MPPTLVGVGRLVRARAGAGRLARDSAQRAPDGPAWPYRGLSPLATSLADLRTDGRSPALNLFLPSLEPGGVFAGIRTALAMATGLSRHLDLPLRVVAPTRRPRASEGAARTIVAELGGAGGDVSFAPLEAITGTSLHPADRWIATYWTTAHALDVACRAGLVDRSRVIYLIQDHEPSFLAASTHQAVAATTYHAGFTPVVNSSPLASFLRAREEIEPSGLVFAPELDLPRLRRAAAARERTATTRVLFYGRPSKPRNMFDLGVAALRVLATRSGRQLKVVSMGEDHPRLRLSGTAWLEPLGVVPWGSYFDALATTDVVLSLQATPHPSHPPLDAVVSGARAVTNDIGGTRRALHPRLAATAPEPDALAHAIEASCSAAVEEPPHQYDDAFLATLGDPLDDVVVRLAGSLS